MFVFKYRLVFVLSYFIFTLYFYYLLFVIFFWGPLFQPILQAQGEAHSTGQQPAYNSCPSPMRGPPFHSLFAPCFLHDTQAMHVHSTMSQSANLMGFLQTQMGIPEFSSSSEFQEQRFWSPLKFSLQLVLNQLRCRS